MYLGVDGGGSKTAFALIDRGGSVVAEYETSGSYYLDIGLPSLKDLIDSGISTVVDNAGAEVDDIEYAFIGLPAYGEDSRMIAELDSVPDRTLRPGTYTCDNDMVCAWAGSLGGGDGINLIAGTGSIGFGRYEGRTARCGGWGELFGDEGSAFWIARKGLQLFSRMSDGRADPGPLLDLVRREIELRQDLDLSTLVLGEWGSDRVRIAGFAQLMYAAAEQCDTQVIDIFRQAADELYLLAESLRSKLRVPAERELSISTSGGVFKSGDLVSKPFLAALNASPSVYRFRSPMFTPVIGAARYAAILSRERL